MCVSHIRKVEKYNHHSETEVMKRLMDGESKLGKKLKKSVQNCYMTKWRWKLVHEDVKSKKKILKTMCEKLDLIEYRSFLENVRIWCNGLHFLGCFIGMSKKISKYSVIFFKVTMEKIPTEEHHRIFP